MKQYEKNISQKKVTLFVGNLDYLHNSLNYLLTAFQPRELISFYLLVSFLRRQKAGNKNLANELAAFAREFMENLSKFSIYDTKPPPGMTEVLFNKYKTYKIEAKIMTTGESIKKRFEIILEEFDRLNPFIQKDKARLHDVEQKRILYFRQKGLCTECNKPMDFKNTSSHHVIAHSKGGKTTDLDKAQLLHDSCHRKVEKRVQRLAEFV